MNHLLSLANKSLRRVQRVQRSFVASLERKILIPSIEFFLADTCNLRCDNCAASAPFLRDPNRPVLQGFVESLSYLAAVARCDELRILGGEPLVNREICSFLRAARQSGLFDRIKVVTNGLLLHKMNDEFWRLADIVRISVYPTAGDRLTEARLESFRATAARTGTTLEVTKTTHFMEAISDTRIDDADTVRRTFANCGEAHGWACHLLYRERLYRCSRVHTLDRYLGRIGVPHENFTDQDGILIDGRDGLYRELRTYLNSPIPLKACSFCYGTSGPIKEHRQLAVEEIRSKLARPFRVALLE